MENNELLRMKDLASERMSGLNVERMNTVLKWVYSQDLKVRGELWDEYDNLPPRKRSSYKSFYEWVYKTKFLGEDEE